MPRSLINRLIILAFFLLVGYVLASNIAYRSFLGISLALISLGSGVFFLYLLSKYQQERAETSNEEIN